MKKIISFILLLITIINCFSVSAINISGRDFDDTLVLASRIYEDYKIPSAFDDNHKDALAPTLSNLISSFKENEEPYIIFNQINLYGNLTDALNSESFSSYINTTKDKTNNFFCLTYIDNSEPKTYNITEKDGAYSIAKEYNGDFSSLAYTQYYLYPVNLSQIMTQHRLTKPSLAKFINIPYLGIHGLYIVCDNIEYIFIMEILNDNLTDIFHRQKLYIVEDFIKKVSPYYYKYEELTSEQLKPENNAFLNTEINLESVSTEFSNAKLSKEEKEKYFLNYELREFEKHFFNNSDKASNPSYSSKPTDETSEKTPEKEINPENNTLVGDIILIIVLCLILIYILFFLYKKYFHKIFNRK